MTHPGTYDLPARPGAPTRLRRLAAACVLVCLASCAPLHAQSQDPPPQGGGFWSAVTRTLPFGALADDTQATSWWRGNWDGAKRIGGDGGTDVILSGWALHPYWGYSPELQAKENDAAYGGGFGRTLTDARGQRRTFYFTVIRDSHWNPQYSVGYMWLARTSMRGPRLGVGYSAFLIGREEYNYLPVPLALPTMSLGWDPAEVIMMYVPGYEVFYFAGRITFPQRAPKD